MVSRELRVVRGQWSVGSNDSPVSDDSCVMCNEWQVVKDEEQLGSVNCMSGVNPLER